MLNQINNQNVSATQQRIEPKKLNLQKGQIFQGQVIKLYPNNLAALRIGNMNVSARLEAALTAGQTYWFEVTQSSGIPRLRVLDDNLVRDSQPTQNINGIRQLAPSQLLQQMGIPANKTNEAVLHLFINQKIPFSKEMILQGGALLNELGLVNEKGVQTLSALVQKGLPLTRETFMAIHTVLQQNGSVLNDVNAIISQLQKLGQPQLQSYVNNLQLIMNSTMIQGEQDQIVQLFTNLGSNQTEGIQQGTMSLLQQLGLVPKNMTLSSFYDSFKNAILNPKNAEIVKSLWPFLQNNGVGGIPLNEIDSKTVYQLFMSKLQIPAGKEGEVRLNQFLSLFQQNVTSHDVKMQLFQLMNHDNEKLSAFEKNVLQQMVRQSLNNTLVQNEQNSPLALQLSKILTNLGINQERELLQFLQGQRLNEVAIGNERLKGLLLQLNDGNLPTHVKKSVQMLIHRLTGHQLLASENSGPIQQIITQFPLQLGQYETELTVQWEGKKKSDGKIDSDHCRILFYLHLERLKETIVDVQIQKRLVSIQVFNEHSRPNFLIDALYPVLKEKLADFHYHLSSFNWRKIEESKKGTNKKENISFHSYEEQNTYQGVDYRV